MNAVCPACWHRGERSDLRTTLQPFVKPSFGDQAIVVTFSSVRIVDFTVEGSQMKPILFALVFLIMPHVLMAQAAQEKQVDQVRSVDAPPSLDGEVSVKPGINKNFIDPDLDVDQFVQRFEIESREVYTARERILAASDISKGDRVADVGAGTGLFTRMFSVKVGERGWVYAVDISPRFIEHINQAAKSQQLDNITGVLCAENSVNLPPDSVDVVFLCDTYHHFEYPKSTLKSIHRALKNDGHLIMIDFDRIEGKSREWLLGHLRAGKEVFRAEIEDAGFSLVQEKKIDGFEENYFLKFHKKWLRLQEYVGHSDFGPRRS